MSHDQQTYRRAANAVLIGLGIQIVLWILTLLTGLYAGEAGIRSLGWYFLGGVPIWIILWVVYNQHRLERVEALETEQLATQDAQAAALFDEAGQQLQIAQKRLDNLYKYGLNIVSLLVSFYLLAVGFGMLWASVDGYRASHEIEQHAFITDIAGMLSAGGGLQDASAGAVAIIAVVIGFLAFIVSRYIAGMTKVGEWKLLRGGAGYLMGNVAVTLVLIAAAAGEAMDLYHIFPVLAVVGPVMMILLGLEMLLGFIFGFYQPRRPGQMPRPAFDSRVLGWLTRPESLAKIVSEAIDYQFGIEVSDSWFYRQVSKAIPMLILVGLLILFGLTSVVIVAPHQRAMVTRLGALTENSEVGPGLHWKMPWPLGKAYKYNASRIHEITVGSSADHFKRDVAVLWTTEHSEGGEDYMVTAPSRHAGEDSTDVDVAAGELAGGLGVIKYRIAEGGLYDYSMLALDDQSTPINLLTALSDRRFNTYFATHDIDSLLTTARVSAGEVLRAQIQGDADEMKLGIEVVYVGVEAVHPPMEGDVAKKFHEQIGARQEKKTKVQEARRKAVAELAQIAGTQDKALKIDKAIQEVVSLQQSLEAMRLSDRYDRGEADALASQITEKKTDIERLLDDAGGDAAILIYEARAYRWEYALSERARAMRTASRFFAYQQEPKYYMAREYLSTLAEGLADRRKYILVGEQPVPPIIRFHAETTTSNLNATFATE
jgi:modulator of FtsH protease HflK